MDVPCCHARRRGYRVALTLPWRNAAARASVAASIKPCSSFALLFAPGSVKLVTRRCLPPLGAAWCDQPGARSEGLAPRERKLQTKASRAPNIERAEGYVYIDATSVGAFDRRFEAEVVRLIRAAMHPFEMNLERIQVHVSTSREGHVCRIHAWAERGQTVVVESSAPSRLGAIETAAVNL
jgi:hypothetical protein